MFGKLFASMYDGTLGTKGPWQALVTLQQFVILADPDGFVDMTAEALARRTSIPLEIITIGIAALEQPDPDSRRPDADGRRIIRIDPHRVWGWRIVNYEYYCKLRNADERREYMKHKMREKRARDLAVDEVVEATRIQPLAELANRDVDGDGDVDVDGPVVKEPGTDLVPQTGQVVDRLAVARGRRALAHRRDVAAIGQRLASVFGQIAADRAVEVSAATKLRANAELVFLFWAMRFGHPNAVLDKKREAKIAARLKENAGDVSELLWALDGASHDPWTMGTAKDSDRKYDDIVTIFRDRSQVERFANLKKGYREGRVHPLLPKLEQAIAGGGAVDVNGGERVE